MKDPVALAWSGRIEEARALACAHAAMDDSLLAAQGYEALAVLGGAHGLRTAADIDALLLRSPAREAPVQRQALAAAAAVESDALRESVAQALRTGTAGWEHLRYAGERPAETLAAALDEGWSLLNAKHIDQALLTACAQPLSTRPQALRWARRTRALAKDPSPSVRVAAFTALGHWRYRPALPDCRNALLDHAEEVGTAAARTLAILSPKQARTLLALPCDELPHHVRSALTQALSAS